MLGLTLDLPIRMAAIEFEGLAIAPDERVLPEIEACARGYRERADAAGSAAPGAIAGVQPARALFRALHIDPTRRRPSSEALLNRALKGKPMPRINTLVDVGNWCSLDFLLPLGIYDLDKIRGDVVLRRGREDESYVDIADRERTLAGRYVLVDDAGPFGSPITDSRRTAVTVATVRGSVLLYAPMDYPPETLTEQAAKLGERVVRFCGGCAGAVELADGG